MKRCFKCGELKPLDSFYKHRKMKDGYLNKCKDCAIKDSKKHRAENIDKVREYDRVRGQTEKRRQKNREYQSYMKEYEPKKWSEMRYKACKKQRVKYRKKYLAKSKVCYAVRSGKLKRKPCEVCGALEVQAHHHDYNKPLDIIWLCDYHHKEEHKKLRALRRAESFDGK